MTCANRRRPRSQAHIPSVTADVSDSHGTISDVADSGALRTERYKRHKMGDHSICRRDCVKPKLVLTVPEAGTSGTDREFDPVGEMRQLAARLAAAYAQDPGNAALARELRATLLALPPEPEGPDALDLLKSRRLRRLQGEELAERDSIEGWQHDLGL